MKRIISILMAALMLCALCVTASAEDTAVVVTPTTNDENIVEICLTEPGNYFIKKDCTLDRLTVMDCTLTIADGVTVTVISRLGIGNGILNIGSGAVLEYCGDSIDNSGTMNVHGTANVDANTFENLGTINVYGIMHVDAFIFKNSGTMNVHGTADISECDEYNNMPSGTINIYTDGSLNGSEKITNLGTISDGLECSGDHIFCDHAFGDNYICTKCGYVNAELHEHDYTTGFMTGKCACGAECPHTELVNGSCTVCDYFDPSQHTHDFTSGTCKCGKTVCDVNGHTLNNGFCTVCDYFDPAKHTHDFSSGICKCGKPCPHENWTDGVCDTCHYVCTHEGEACATCGKSFEVKEESAPAATASALSEGNMVIVVGVAGVAVGFLAAMFIFKKKKPAPAESEN